MSEIKYTYAFDLGDHGTGVIGILEDSLDRLLTLGDCVQILLGGPLLLLVLVDHVLDLLFLLQSLIDSYDVKKFSFTPVVQVLIRVLHGIAQVLDVALNILGSLELRVAEDHLLLVTFNVVGEVEFLILIEHLEEYLVVDDALALVRHVGCDGLDHRLQHGDDLLGEMGEFHALLVKFVLLYWIVQVLLDVEQSSVLLNDVQSASLRDGSQELLDVA